MKRVTLSGFKLSAPINNRSLLIDQLAQVLNLSEISYSRFQIGITHLQALVHSLSIARDNKVSIVGLPTKPRGVLNRRFGGSIIVERF